MCSGGHVRSVLPQHTENNPSASKHRAVRLLGWDVAHLSPTQQFVLIAGLSIFFNLIYGTLQEYLVVNVFKRRLGLFMSLLQTLSFSALAHLQRLHLGEAHVRRIPLRWYLLLALAQSSSMALGNVGMMYLNYAAKVLFKSTKAVPMMLWGSFFLGKQYRRREFLSVAIMVTGLVVFLEADASSPAVFSLVGVVLMVACVFMDCCYSNLAELLLRRYDATSEEVIFYTYMGGAMYQASSALVSGELAAGVRFVAEGGWHSLPVVLAYTTAGYLGASCATALTKNYGALSSTLASATRKALNLLFSFALFPKPFTALHLMGVSLFMSGLVSKTALQQRSGGGGGGGGGAAGGGGGAQQSLACAPGMEPLKLRCAALDSEEEGYTAPPSAYSSPGEQSPLHPLLPLSPVASVLANVGSYQLLKTAVPFVRLRAAHKVVEVDPTSLV
eukprot:TRINITY_DN5701_c0_g1_i1.p1 TRINITY_DN5701_c0_g1~~TRINITY_DN5701_c0_g1_i1.p1  ORF type:complete len:444 (+),score=145.14 TRINITY_DN5701_c0_g1_i1:107-1438(+)